jgi:hypothetical protein
MASPTVIPITWPNDPLQAQIEDFVNTLGGSSFWTAAGAEYGVGAMTMGTPVELTSDPFGSTLINDNYARVMDSRPGEIATWINEQVRAGMLPPGDGNTIYALFPPAGTDVYHGGATSCQASPPFSKAFFAYHDEAYTGMMTPYVVVPRCATRDSLTGLDVVTAAASEEILEAAMNPSPIGYYAAYDHVDADHASWSWVFGGGEAGDLCAQNPGAFFQPDDFAYTVQRTWSNAAARGGHDPCVPPIPGQVYFNSAPVLNDTVAVSVNGKIVPTRGLWISPAQSKTVELDLYSDGPTDGDWTVSAIDQSVPTGQLDVQFDKTSGHNGDTIQMTVTLVPPGYTDFKQFLIVSQLGSQTNIWPVVARTGAP